MKHKFSKILGIGLTLALLASMLVIAAPVSAATAVSDVYVEFPYANTKNVTGATANDYIVHFKPGTALVRGADYVTVVFPSTFSISSKPLAADLEFSTDYGTAAAALTGGTWKRASSDSTLGGLRVKVKMPISVAAGTSVWLRITSNTITAASTAANTYTLKVYTTKDPDQITSSTFALDSTLPASLSTAFISGKDKAGTAGGYKFTFQPAAQQTGDVTIKFPVGTVMPSTIAMSSVVFSTDGSGGPFVATAEPVVVDVARRMVTATTPVVLDADTNNIMWIKSTANVINPTVASSDDYFAMIRTGPDGQWKKASGTHTVVAGTGTKIIITTGEIGLDSVKPYSDDATMVNMYSHQIFVTVADQFGNAVTAGTEKVDLTTSSSTGVFYKNAHDTGINAFTSATQLANVDAAAPTDKEQTVYYKDTAAGSYTLTFTDNDTVTPLDTATWTFTVAPAVLLYDSSNNLVNTYEPGSTATAETGDGGPAQAYSADYINNAIAAAMAGDTVKLGDGIYEMDNNSYINLNQRVTLTSVNGASSTTIRNTQTVNYAVLVGISGTSSNPVIINGLTFESLRTGVDIESGVRNVAGYDYVTVSNNIFNSIQPNAQRLIEGVIWFEVANDISSLTISNNTINNSITDYWPDFSGSKGGVIVVGYASAQDKSLSGVSITGNVINNSDGVAILTEGNSSAGKKAVVSITNNTITNGYSPINTGNDHASLTITGNTITGSYGYGMKIEGDNNTALVIKNNTVTGNAGYAIRIEKGLVGSGVTGYIQYNDVSNNGDYGIRFDSDAISAYADYDAKYNWYGSASGPTYTALVGAKITKSNPDGTGATITDGVLYYPWLHKSLATVVADNASYPTFSVSLSVGWNTLSVPGKLIAGADGLNDLVPSGVSVAYTYSASGGWQPITTNLVINPLDAIYIKMSSAKTVLLKVDGKAMSTPTKSLAAGWNLVGLASLTAKTNEQATASIPSTSFGQMVSPSLNASEWVYIGGGSSVNLAIGEGYWIYLNTAADIAGFTILPMAPSLN